MPSLLLNLITKPFGPGNGCRSDKKKRDSFSLSSYTSQRSMISDRPENSNSIYRTFLLGSIYPGCTSLILELICDKREAQDKVIWGDVERYADFRLLSGKCPGYSQLFPEVPGGERRPLPKTLDVRSISKTKTIQ